MWPLLWKAAAIFVSTFVLEDVAAIGAGVLLATGVLAWPLAFGACFSGIWIGDVGLYVIARVIGRNLLARAWFARSSGRIERSEQWFARSGDSILVFSRMLPGARLPTYLAAGFLRLPLKRFLLVTGLASFAWTGIILTASQVIGTKLLSWLGLWQKTSLVFLAGVAIAFVTLHVIRKFAASGWPSRFNTYQERLKRWEFWPAWIFYPPVVLYYVRLAIKHRGLTLPTAANPGIFSGGIVGESKIALLKTLMATSPEFTAEAELIMGESVQQRLESLREICRRRNIDYPVILKPDVGQRGAGVKLIQTELQAAAYFERTHAPLIVQRYALGPHEAGVFYYRFPGQPRGRIFAITEKIFPMLIGDGRSTVSELVHAEPRARFMATRYLRRLAGRRDEILAAGQTLRLVEAGNHAQGCIFRDGDRFSTPALAERIDGISRKIPGFFIGRYDLRFANEDELRSGNNFQIVELNGAASEATNIYDSKNSIFEAYRTLFRQWDLVFAIGAANRRRGSTATPVLALWRKWREYNQLAASYPVAD